jgi:hypothetical protein
MHSTAKNKSGTRMKKNESLCRGRDIVVDREGMGLRPSL